MNLSIGCTIALAISMTFLAVSFFGCVKINNSRTKKKSRTVKNNFLLTPFQILVAGVFLCIIAIFYPIYFSGYFSADSGIILIFKSFLLSVHNTMRVFILDGEFDIVKNFISDNGIWQGLGVVYTVYAAILYVAAPVLTAGFVLSFFKNINERIKYSFAAAKHIFYFSELNEKSVALAESIVESDEYKDEKVLIAFFDVYEANEEASTELVEAARKIGGLCFQKDIVNVKLKKAKKDSTRKFYFLGADEDENINQAIELIRLCREKSKKDKQYNSNATQFYVFSNTVESEVLLDAVDKGEMRVRRYDESRNLVIDTLREFSIFKPAVKNGKAINILIVGLGKYGKQLLKNICWLGQMPGYELTINVVDDVEKGWNELKGEVPELLEMSGKHSQNGGPCYTINTFLDVNVDSERLSEVISKMGTLTTVYVTLGDDELNIRTAMRIRRDLLRWEYELRRRIGKGAIDPKPVIGIPETDFKKQPEAQPLILAVVYSKLKTDIIRQNGIRSIDGKDYNIKFFGDIKSIYSIKTVEQVDIEEAAQNIHSHWAKSFEKKEKDTRFESFEYHRRSTIANYVYLSEKTKMQIEIGYTAEELAKYEHNRWCAYMRAEGFKKGEEKNLIAKTHPDLIPYDDLPKYKKDENQLFLNNENTIGKPNVGNKAKKSDRKNKSKNSDRKNKSDNSDRENKLKNSDRENKSKNSGQKDVAAPDKKEQNTNEEQGDSQ